jgi:fatty-acyl-CoA synthase
LDYAVRRCGCRAVVSDVGAVSDRGAAWLKRSALGVVLAGDYAHPSLAQPAARNDGVDSESGPPDTVDIIFTAGTTGLPTPIVHDAAFYTAHARGRSAFLGTSDEDTALAVSPLFHVGGIHVMMMAMLSGAPLAVLPRWDPSAFLRAINEFEVSFVHLVGAAVVDVANLTSSGWRPETEGRFRFTLTGGSALSSAHVRRYEEITHSVVVEGYGRTEGGCCWNPPTRSGRRLGSQGLPLTDIAQLRIAEPGTNRACAPGTEGEIQLRGPGVSTKVWGDHSAAESDCGTGSWFQTGDLGYQDEEGYLHFTGRRDGLIKTGGENVSPFEVERSLLDMPGIREVAVVGIPDHRLGQLVAALVSADDGIGVTDIKTWSRSRLAGFQVPRYVQLRPRLPRLGSNKVDYKAVRDIRLEENHVAADL